MIKILEEPIMMNNEITKENFDIEELEDFEVNEEITYLVCALGYNEDDDCTDCEVYLKDFADPDEAIAYAKTVDLATILQFAAEQKQDISDMAYFSLEVETVVECEDPEDGTENIDTVYQRELWIDGEYGSVEDAEPTIFIYNKDYELLEDGTLKVRRELLKDYNKNDRVKLCFAEEDSCSLTYKIISKVEYTDGDYYHLDFIC
jgi:hypothetical protein